MSIPLAVLPSELTPGLRMSVDFLSGPPTPGSAPLAMLVVAPRSTAGDLAPDTEIRRATTPGSAATAFGAGTPGHLVAELVLAAHPFGVLDMIAPTASAGDAASVAVTFSGPATSSGESHLWIAGRLLKTPWLNGEDADVHRAAVVAHVNSKSYTLPVIAAPGAATGELTLTFKVPGAWGNDCRVRGLVTASGGSVTVPAPSLSGGTSEPDLSAALTAVQHREYHIILPCLSNADAADPSEASNAEYVLNHIERRASGLSPTFQTAVVGMTSSIGAATAGSVGRNAPSIAGYILCQDGEGLPCELGAARAVDALASEEIDPAANRIGSPLRGFRGAADVDRSQPVAGEVEAALRGGVDIVQYTAQGAPVCTRPVTTHSQDDQGNPDRRVLDRSVVTGMFAVARDLRAFLPVEFQGAKLSKDTPPGEELPPQGVVEERDVKAAVVQRLRGWTTRGVVRADKLDEALADGSLIIRVNGDDESQLDIVLPLKIFPPLAKMGVVLLQK